MSLALDPQTEQRIRQEAARGPYDEAIDLINHALDLVSEEQHLTAEEKAEFDHLLDRRMSEFTRGEGISGDRAREMLAAGRLASRGMNPFELVPGCLRDLLTLIADKEAKHGKEAADDLEELLFSAFGRLAHFPAWVIADQT